MKKDRGIIRWGKTSLAVLFIIFCATVSLATAASIEKQLNALKIEDKEFDVNLEVLAPTVNVGQPMSFAIKANKEFYLYLFVIDDNDKGYMILPNKLQQYSIYQADERYVVPEETLRFYSNHPGTEEVIMIAATKKLELTRDCFQTSGKFMAGSRDKINKEVKALHSRASKMDCRIVTRRIFIQVDGNTTTGVALPFVSCNKTHFHIGERMFIRVGADKAGFITLFNRGKNGRIRRIEEVKVDGENFQRISTEALGPVGTSTLIAVWSAEKDVSQEVVDEGIRLSESGTEEFSTFAYTLEK
ncbi:MAG: hypothetical protein CSB28_00625 [Desulfobacterales bacterium]|nr:MAG: hypothetical protein CSB28_00625 [Desulfobacterales bacterium]